MRRRGVEALLALAAVLVAAPAAFADAGRVMDEVVSTVLPVTPAQSREIAALLRSPRTVAVDVVDTTGCGDAFSAGFIWGLVEGVDVVEAAERGLACGSLVATGLGSDAGLHSAVDVARLRDEGVRGAV